MICSGRDKIETPEQVGYNYSIRSNFPIRFLYDNLTSPMALHRNYLLKQTCILYMCQFKKAEETVNKLDLDGLVVIGGDDSNTNACLLAENFR